MSKFLKIFFALTIFSTAILAQAKENPFGREEVFESKSSFEKGKSRWVAAGLSLLFPGGGELYLGDKKNATKFFAAEGSIWCAFTGFTVYGNWRKENFKSFAAIHAKVRPEGKDEKFFEDVLRYSSRDSYNYWNHLVYRDYYPSYPTTDEYYWKWESDEAWDEYAEIRKSSERAYRNAKVVLGVALINRVISVVHVLKMEAPSDEISRKSEFIPQAYITRSENEQLNLGLGLSIDF